MPPKNRAKNAPNQHDKRHESGLAAPGKRVTKKGSNGHLNGQIYGKSTSASGSAQPSPPPAVGITSGFEVPHAANDGEAADGSLDHTSTGLAGEKSRVGSDVLLEEIGPRGETREAYQESPSVDTTGTPCKKTTFANVNPTVASVSTLLAYYPLRDAISILILLLSLQPTLVLVIQALFASLTFVPPTASISLSSLPNIKEIFNSSNFGYPALATILIVDLIFWVCWLPVWRPVQNVFLDFSQAVIAISLSGASASATGPTYSIATCTAIVCIAHVLRYKAIHLTALDYLRSVLHKLDIVDAPSFATSIVSSPSVDRGWFYTVVRTILGIHIVSQGVTTCIRRSLVKANEQSSVTSAIPKSDLELTYGADSLARPSTGTLDGAQPNHPAQSADVRSMMQSSAARDSKARESASKKKRKQANQVRSHQPLWAAIASTKVTFVKEMEQRDAFDDAREAASMNPNIDSDPRNQRADSNRIWISEVSDSGIIFSVVLGSSVATTHEGSDDRVPKGSDLGRTKAFYLRINGHTWSSTRIMTSADEGVSPNQFHGEIFGLAPLSHYKCEVMSTADHKLLCSTSIITRPASTAEQSAAFPQPPPQSIRPASPITSLKQSINQAEIKLNEVRNRSKRNKRDHRAAHAEIKREINALRAKIGPSGGAEDKLERKLLQLKQHKSQAEEATAEIKAQIEALGEIPEEDLAAAETARRKWQAASQAKSAASRDLEKAKSESERELNSIKSDIAQTEAKREKLTARLLQRDQELEALIAKQEADNTARQQRDLERAQVLQRREDEEGVLRYQVSLLDAELGNIGQKAQDAYQEIATLQSWSTQSAQPPPYPGYSSPPTPDNGFPLPNGAPMGSPHSTTFPNFVPSQHAHHSSLNSAHNSVTYQQQQQNVPAPRGRSCSMLSQYSGFTDFGPENNWPGVESQAHAGAVATNDDAAMRERQGSSSLGSGSGSTGSSSPRNVGTIGPPNGKLKEKDKCAAPLSGLGR